jgi:hypothetical protein
MDGDEPQPRLDSHPEHRFNQKLTRVGQGGPLGSNLFGAGFLFYWVVVSISTICSCCSV